MSGSNTLPAAASSRVRSSSGSEFRSERCHDRLEQLGGRPRSLVDRLGHGRRLYRRVWEDGPMARIVALLRGVNIGKRQLPMAGLRSGLEAAGCTDVATYVQSGNVVLTPPKEAGQDVAGWLADAIGEIAGFAVPVVVRTKTEMAKVTAANPYPDAGGTTLHVIFCSSKPPALTAELDAVAPEHATVVGRDVFLHLPNGMGRATLPALVEKDLKRAGVVGTARNWNTVETLLAML
jgi:uncharacterized protein (DUF1697 family)